MYDYNYYDYGTTDYGSALGGLIGGLLIFWAFICIIALAVSIVTIIAQWKLYKKAGKGGWEAIVPFYCNYVLVEIADLKWYWFLGFFAPMVFSFIGLDIIGYLVYYFTIFVIFFNLSKKFNKGIGFAICGCLFTPICIWILGFSKSAVYNKSVPVSPHGVFGSPENKPVEPQYQQSVPSSQSAFCTNCGSPLIPDSKFCTNCGKQI